MTHSVMLDRLRTDNERMREALRLIRDLADAQRLVDVGRLARAALVACEPANPGLRPCQLTHERNISAS